MTDNNKGDYLVSKGYANYVFVLLFLLYLFDYIDRQIVSSLIPFIKAEWHITDTQCGMMTSVVYWSIVAFTFPASIIIDRWSRKKSIGIMAIIWSLATAAAAITKNFSQLIATRSAIGIGEAGYAPGGTAMISALYPEERRSRMIGIWNASIPLGGLIGMVLGGYIATHFGWRHAFGVVAVPGLFIAILFFFVKDYKTVSLVKRNTTGKSAREPSASGNNEAGKMSKMDIVREFTSKKSLMLTNIAFAGNTFMLIAYLNWLPTYFHRVDNLAMTQAGLKGGLVMFMAVVGTPVGGYITDRWIRKKPRARLLVPAITSFLSAGIFFTAFYFLSGTAQYTLLLIGGATGIAFSPGAIAVTQDVMHAGLRAVSYSVCVICQNLLGSSLGPIFVGAVSDRTDLKTALTVVPVFGIIAGILYLIGSFYYDHDKAMVTDVELIVN